MKIANEANAVSISGNLTIIVTYQDGLIEVLHEVASIKIMDEDKPEPSTRGTHTGKLADG